ncbi:MAG: biotin--[acetyl-CoA-carboxylase] ligase [Flavisolibacter sp.]|nr:biotin--[acetyl-CoA-carboxylase] ligase [Flavisolibacter sp.]
MINVPFIELQQVDSTNNYATALVHAGMAQHGTAVFAHEQTEGRGQRQKVWETGKGENIAISIILYPQAIALSQVFLVSMATALGAHHFFSRYAGADTKIKWPNDLYWRDRKAGGILIENSIQAADWKYAVAGIGININQTQFSTLVANAVSLKQITGHNYNTVELAKELHSDVLHRFEVLQQQPEEIITGYHSHLYKKDEKVKLKKGSRIFDAIIKEVTLQGLLVVQHAVEEQFGVGEVEWVG